MKKWIALLSVLVLMLSAAAGSADVAVYSTMEKPMDTIQLQMEEEAETCYIVFDTDVTAFVLEEVVVEEDAAVAHALYTRNAVQANDVFALQAYMGEVVPRFRMNWIDAEGVQHRCYIAMSGEDGSLLLIDAEDVESMIPVTEGEPDDRKLLITEPAVTVYIRQDTADENPETDVHEASHKTMTEQ